MAVELGSVQKTLLLPLWGRAVETGKAHPLLVDRTAARIVASLDYDFSTIARNISPITRPAWIARSLHIDRTLRASSSVIRKRSSEPRLRSQRELSLKEKWGTMMSDVLRIMSAVHVRLSARERASAARSLG